MKWGKDLTAAHALAVMRIRRQSTFKWTHETITLLLNGYHRRVEFFRNPQVKKSTLWKQICEEFEAEGYEISSENLDSKFRNLKKTYIKICKNNKISTGSGPVKWEYFHVFNEIFSEEVAIHIDPNVMLDDSNLDQMNPENATIKEEETNDDTNWLNDDLIASEVVKMRRKRKREENYDIVEPSGDHSDSSMHSSYLCETSQNECSSETLNKKGKPGASLRDQREKILKLEEERVLALKNISKRLEENLILQKEQIEIQKERNRLLTSILEKLN